MLVAVLSDIHANDVALRRCIEHAFSRGAKAFCFLGDYMGDLAGVRETMKLLRGVMDAHHHSAASPRCAAQAPVSAPRHGAVPRAHGAVRLAGHSGGVLGGGAGRNEC